MFYNLKSHAKPGPFYRHPPPLGNLSDFRFEPSKFYVRFMSLQLKIPADVEDLLHLMIPSPLMIRCDEAKERSAADEIIKKLERAWT